MAKATFGGGCFWCIEAALEEIRGVESVVSGYAGGTTPDPTYKEVCSGTTGHAEVVQVEYDPVVISYEELLAVLFTVHDPTTVDRQGPDVGSQYRSIVLYHDEEQRRATESFLDEISEEYDDPIVTEVTELDTFHEAEPYHQNYFEKNPEDAYCRMHAAPKIEKVRERFPTQAVSADQGDADL